MANGPAGMTTRERSRSQNFGPNVVIGGGFSGNPFVGGGGSSSTNPQDMNIQPAVSVGFGQGQVDPGLAAAAGIGGTSQFTGDFNPNQQDQTGGIISTGSQDTGSQDTGSQDTDDKKTITEKVKETTKKIVDVFTGDEIKRLDEQSLKKAKELLAQYQALGETNPLKLRALMTSNIFGGIFGKDQTVSDMEGKVVTNPEDAFDNDGNLKEGFRFTREGIIGQLENIDPEMNIMKSLEFYEPRLIMENFGLPQTSAGLDKFANLQLTGDKRTDAMIIEARERLADDRNRNQPQTAGFAGIPGIPSLPIPKPPEEKPSYPLPGQPPFMPGPGLPPGVIPPYGSKFEKTPYNYYAQSPQYRFRGVPSLNTNEFNEQLRRLYGVG
jgi:hypothetical protein